MCGCFFVLGALANFQAAFLNNATVLTSGQNVNNLGAGYYYSFSTAIIQSLSNVPSGLEQEIVLFCAPRIRDNPYGYQMLWALHQDVVYIRHYHNQSGWSTWARIDTNIPAFYKDYSTISALAIGVNATQNLSSTDANTVKETGYYATQDGMSNLPSTAYGQLVVWKVGSRVIQFWWRDDFTAGMSLYMRGYFTNINAWSDWKSLYTFTRTV